MTRKTGLIIVLVLVLVWAGVVVAKNKKTESKRPAVQQTQPTRRPSVRSGALRYVSEAYRKARQGDYDAAVAACDKAEQMAPNDPAAKTCKRRIERFKK